MPSRGSPEHCRGDALRAVVGRADGAWLREAGIGAQMHRRSRHPERRRRRRCWLAPLADGGAPRWQSRPSSSTAAMPGTHAAEWSPGNGHEGRTGQRFRGRGSGSRTPSDRAASPWERLMEERSGAPGRAGGAGGQRGERAPRTKSADGPSAGGGGYDGQRRSTRADRHSASSTSSQSGSGSRGATA